MNWDKLKIWDNPEEEVKQEKNKKSKEFRIQAKWFYLKYPGELNFNLVLKELKKKSITIKDYIIGHTENGEIKETKVIIKLRNRKNITKKDYFDIAGVKGEYNSGKNKQEIIAEIIKANRYKWNMYIVNGELKSLKEYLVDLVREGKLPEAMDILNKEADYSIIINDYSKLVRNLTNLHENLHHKKSEGEYDYNQYNFPEEIIEWFTLKDKRSLVVVGPSGYGKTQGMLALTKYFNNRPLLITEKNDLKKINPKTDIIIMDDLSMEKFDVNELKHLLDSEKTSSIRVLYSSQEIKKEIRRIWILNNFNIPAVDPRDKEAIMRRIYDVHLFEPMFNE